MKPYESKDSKSSQVRRMFDRIAPRYDGLNRLFSLGIDRQWRQRLVAALREDTPRQVLDVATGTADLAIAIARGIPGVHVTGIDLSAGMIARGQRKVERRNLAGRVALQEGDASALNFQDGGFDAVSVAFGVRNFEDMEGGIAQMHRVLRCGGRLAVLEFSTPHNKIFAACYRFYFHKVMPLVGGWVSGDREAYGYLPSSVDEFPSPEQFMEKMRRAGFSDCTARPLSGGIAYLYTGISK